MTKSQKSPRRRAKKRNLTKPFVWFAVAGIYCYLFAVIFYRKDFFLADFYAEIAAWCIVALAQIALMLRQKRVLFLENKNLAGYAKAVTINIFFGAVFAVPLVAGAKVLYTRHFGAYEPPVEVRIVDKSRTDSLKGSDGCRLYPEPKITKHRLHVSCGFYDKVSVGDRLIVKKRASNFGYYIDEREIEILR